MKILVNDFSGHAFTIQLSRQLALMGHNVLHAYSSSFQSPKGDLTLRIEDTNLQILPIANKEAFVKYSILKRRKQEIEYADVLIGKLKIFRPDVILIGNTPLFVQKRVQQYSLKRQIKFVYWCQDIYSIAIEKIARKKIGIFGWPLWWLFYGLEKGILRKSDAIISITEDFQDIFDRWGLIGKKVKSIPNWAPINQIPVVAKENSWSRKYKLDNKFCVFYTGTLGLKHNPDILVQAAIRLKIYTDVVFVVISEGLGADYIMKKKIELKLDNIKVFPFQPFNEMPSVLATADVLVSVLEADAGIFSVPSKVLSYLCAGKPILIAAPAANLASKIIVESKSGFCIDNDDVNTFVDHILHIRKDNPLKEQFSRNARLYAEKNFQIDKIARHFLKILEN